MTAILKLLDILPGWLWAALLAGSIATNCASLAQRDHARSEMADLRAMHAEAARAAEASARAKEQAAALTLSQVEKEARDAQKRLSADLAAAHRELRLRPERPSGSDVSTSPGSPVGCTGASLFAEDAGVALREAARADRLRLQLESCKAAYEQAVILTR